MLSITSLKQHSEYPHFQCKIQLDLSVYLETLVFFANFRICVGNHRKDGRRGNQEDDSGQASDRGLPDPGGGAQAAGHGQVGAGGLGGREWTIQES